MCIVVGVLQFVLRLPEVLSLKEKRSVIKSVNTRIRNRFNVSVSEVDEQDKWQLATIAVAHIGADRKYANQILDQVLNLVRDVRSIEVVDSKLEFY